MDFKEKILTTEDIFKGFVFDVKLHTVELPDGSTARREALTHNGGVGIVAIDDEGKVFMVRQYRFGVDDITLEIPAGKLEKGENPYDAAMRELCEETGYATDELKLIGECYPTPAYCSEKIYLYLATELTYKGQKLDEDEFLNVERYDLDTLYNMVLDNKILDAKTAIAILKTKAILNK